MTNKQIFVVVVYLLIFGACGFAFGHSVGTTQQYKTNAQCDYDVNNDGEINSLDLLVLQKYILNN